MKYAQSISETHRQEEKAAEAAMDVEETDSSNAAAQPKGGEEKAGAKQLHVLGIGGRRAKRSSSKATGSKKTPGEIRIQKGEALVEQPQGRFG